MLTLEPAVAGTPRVALFADHNDPSRSRFYYQPLVPRVSYEGTAPQLHLIAWRGEAGQEGMLNLTVNVGMNRSELEGIAEQLRGRYGLAKRPQLDPIPLLDGTVKLMLLGSESGKETGESFPLKINQPARPALYGNNGAVFSVQLGDADSVSMVQRTLENPKGDMLPIGIVYSLRFWAMRPPYSFTFKADWSAVRKRLFERFGLNLVFLQVAIEKEVDQLIAQGAISIKEQDVRGSAVQSRDRMVDVVKSAVLNTFFEPAILPPSSATSGTGMPLGFSRLKSVEEQRLTRSVGASVTEFTPVERALYPAAYLTAITPAGGAASLITLLDPGRTAAARTVNVSSQGDFAADGIKSIKVWLQYGSDAENKREVLLNKPDDQQTVSWQSIVAGGAMKREVAVEHEVQFDLNHPLHPPATIKAPASNTTLDKLVIVPRDLYRVLAVPITTQDWLWDDYREVRLRVKYGDASITREVGFTLTPQKRVEIWRVLIREMGQLRFRYQAEWVFGDLGTFKTPWQDGTGEQIPLRDPYPERRNLRIVPDFDWSQVSKVLARVQYRNPARQSGAPQFSCKIEFTPDRYAAQSLVFPEIGSLETPILYTVWVSCHDGTLLDFPPSYTQEGEDTVTLTAALPHDRVILVRPQVGDFATQRLKQMQVDVRYDDPVNKREDSPTLNLDAPEATSFFALQYADPDNGQYQYRVTYQFEDGRSQLTDWQEWSDGGTSPDLVIPGPPPPDAAQM